MHRMNTATISLFTVQLRKIPWSEVFGSNGHFCHSAACNGRMNEARLSHLPFWGPSEAFLLSINRFSG